MGNRYIESLFGLPCLFRHGWTVPLALRLTFPRTLKCKKKMPAELGHWLLLGGTLDSSRGQRARQVRMDGACGAEGDGVVGTPWRASRSSATRVRAAAAVAVES